MRRAVLFFCALPLLVSTASAPVPPETLTADASLNRAKAEAEISVRHLIQLEKQAENASDEAAKLRAQRLAAAAAIDAAEAQISKSVAEYRLARARIALAEQQLARKRAPLAALLAGLAQMGRQPPLLSLADHGSIDEIVRVKALLDSTLPAIQRQSAAASAKLKQRQQLAAQAYRLRATLQRDRAALRAQQTRFAELEANATARAARLSGEAFGAGDRVLAAGERLSTASSTASERRAAARVAVELANLDFATARPMPGDAPLSVPDFHYGLPVTARVADGLGSVSRSGIVSRGVQFDTARGSPVVAPADGTVAFAAPFRGQDGLVIIDHGKGWTTLLLGVASDKRRGTRVARGESIGRTLGPVGVELRRDGKPVSPAFIAASSPPLSNSAKSR
ncbi:murein hydrolase activator EnvC family protein [Sphingomonas edaphi]|uniref:M23ase beta-sheet core domain-containing protein n=1 Tax=Sphingomonas edaphi TaxID=2315689 RepID=A0A418Q326_9SPHN|nr:peptidoglycan DD-metalloendopeptidase family protein [Sphingomonas edaphi]RIX32223.1 hypothetical protein D3M59_04465 [Sphingomonas edaphi]